MLAYSPDGNVMSIPPSLLCTDTMYSLGGSTRSGRVRESTQWLIYIIYIIIYIYIYIYILYILLCIYILHYGIKFGLYYCEYVLHNSYVSNFVMGPRTFICSVS